jgi:branched-chain amino acid transport system substrate-binding protein
MTRRNGRRLGAVVGVTVLVLAVAACGSSSKKSSSSSTTSQSTTVSNSGSARSSVAQAASYYATYTHGSAGSAASSQPAVSIGYFDDIGGAPSFPDNKVAANAAVQFVNNDLGGVAGHPIKLVDCFVATTEQQGQACAQQFLAQKVKVVVEGTALLGAQALHSALNGAIPVVVSDPANLADATAKNSYSLTAGGFATIPALVSAAKALKAKTASLLFPSDDPTGLHFAGEFDKAAGAAGITLTKAGFATSSPDILPSVIAAKSRSTDVTWTFFAVPSACIAGAKAFQRANVTKPIMTLGTCLATPVKEGLGDYPKWLYANLVEYPAAPNPDSAVQGYLQVMRHYAGANANTGELPAGAWLGVLAAVRAMNLAGGAGASTSAISNQLKAYTGPTPMTAPTVKYGSVPGLPTLPNAEELLYQYHGNGSWTTVAGGKWLGAP